MDVSIKKSKCDALSTFNLSAQVMGVSGGFPLGYTVQSATVRARSLAIHVVRLSVLVAPSTSEALR